MARYMVFARTEYAEPLSYQGELEAEEQQAEQQAGDQYGLHWLELVLIPESEIHWLLRSEETEVEAAP